MTEFKQKPKIGTLSLIRNHFKGKDGKSYDLVIVETIDPVTGNKIKQRGVIGYDKAPFPHKERNKDTGAYDDIPKNHATLDFDGIKFAGQLKFDYSFEPVAVLEKKVKPAAPAKKPALVLPQVDEDNPF